MNSSHYILLGKKVCEVPIEQWAKWFRGSKRRIAVSKIGGQCVSTVFLGIDHKFMEGPPILFETMIFGGRFDGWMWRYCTYNEAVTGHRRVAKNFNFLKRIKPKR